MWECIINAWAWLGSNSGQVQTLIAILALVLAYVVYKKVLEQIRISQEQTRFTQQQRTLDLRISTLNLINENIQNNLKNIILIDSVVSQMENLHSKLVEINDVDSVKLESLIGKMVSYKLETEGIKKQLVSLFESFKLKQELSDSQFNELINTLAGTLAQSSSSSFEYTSMLHEIELIKKEKNLK